ncbi:MAG: Gfo/Idh/MocA family oxidoreductase [Minisyncoccia bacterium]
MKKINSLLIGVGYHAKRIYLPYLKGGRICRLVACWDLASQKEKVEDSLKKIGMTVPCYYAKNDSISDALDKEDRDHLDQTVKKHGIEAVIISTEPLAHFKYAKWALENGLHILLDKPISTAIDVSTNENKARKLFRDYMRLAELYIEKNKKEELVFSIQAQRRFHIGFRTVRKKIIEMAKLSDCPVTFIQTFHSDGQWTFPSEFIGQTYHPYNQGYGKMSHSGFHSLDIAIWLVEASLKSNKKWDNFRLGTTFVRPSDILAQFSKKDYLQLFPGMKWDRNIKKEIKKVTGEVDASTQISFLDGKNIITSVNCNSLHNSFSRRGWPSSVGRDLYKGNGRVRQESYIIEQGPFQSIIINSLQSEEIQKGGPHPYEVGGEYHFDIHIFRNKSIFPKLKSYEYLNLQSLNPVADLGYSRGHQEDARRNCIEDFYRSILKRIPPEKQGSNILYHGLTAQILSAIYVSAAKQYHRKNGMVNGEIKFRFNNKSYVQ